MSEYEIKVAVGWVIDKLSGVHVLADKIQFDIRDFAQVKEFGQESESAQVKQLLLEEGDAVFDNRKLVGLG